MRFAFAFKRRHNEKKQPQLYTPTTVYHIKSVTNIYDNVTFIGVALYTLNNTVGTVSILLTGKLHVITLVPLISLVILRISRF